jgi:hypothetical protein
MDIGYSSGMLVLSSVVSIRMTIQVWISGTRRVSDPMGTGMGTSTSFYPRIGHVSDSTKRGCFYF